MLPSGTRSQAIELSALHVSLELLVPQFGVEVCEPLAQTRQFIARQFPDLTLNIFHLGHQTPLFTD